MSDDDFVPETTEEDAETLRLLEAALGRFDPPPASLMRFGRESQRLIQFESELAEIVADSLLSDGAATRASGDLRTVTCEANGLQVLLELYEDRVVAQIEPPPAAVLVMTPSAEQAEEIRDGGFVHFAVPEAPFRLRCVVDGRTVVTDWVRP